MHEDRYRPNCIVLVLGDNDMTFKSGAPRDDMRMDTFPSAFHQRRADAVALCETVAGVGRVLSTVPFPRFQVKRGKLVYNPLIPHNRIAAQYIQKLPTFRPGNSLPFVRQKHMVPYKRGRSLYPRTPDKSLFKTKDGIHPALGSFDELLKPILEDWIARC